MVAPVTGPFDQPIPDSKTVYRSKQVWKQAKPIDRPLPYHLEESRLWAQLIGDNVNFPFASQGVSLSNQTFSAIVSNTVREKAFAKLQGRINDNAQWGVNLAEYRQSMSMMTRRLTQIFRSLRYLRKGDLISAGRELGVSKLPKSFQGASHAKNASKSLANTWLEFSFGWKPLVEDIYSSVDLLQTPIKSIRPRAASTETLIRRVETGSQNSPSGFWTLDDIQGLGYCRMGCEVTINNPNLFLANNLGLVNPAVVVWELIPFSFVVDWFANVGSFLNSGTAFLGLTVTNPWTSVGYKTQWLCARYNPFWAPNGTKNMAIYRCANFSREVGLGGPTLHVRPWRIPGWQRAANAASLVTQILTKSR